MHFRMQNEHETMMTLPLQVLISFTLVPIQSLQSLKKQRTVTRSSTEATTVVEIHWICCLHTELHVYLSQQRVIYCDNVSATNLCSNLVFYSRIKHVALDYHFIQEQVQDGSLRVAHVSSVDVLANPLTRTSFLLTLPTIGKQNWSHRMVLHLAGS